MAFRISRITVKNNVTVNLAEGGVGCGKGSQHRTVNGSGTVGPGQSLGEVPQNPPGIFPGSGHAVAENLIAAILDRRPGHIDQDGGTQRRDDVDAVELGQRQAAAIEVAAVQRKDIERLIGAGQIQLSEYHLPGSVGGKACPEGRSTLQILLGGKEIDGSSGNQLPVGVAHGVAENSAARIDHRVAAGIGASCHIDGPIHHKGCIGISRGQGRNTGTNAVVTEGGISAHRYTALRVGIAQAQIAEDKYVIIIGNAEIDCHIQSSYRNCTGPEPQVPEGRSS